jgi:beta-lactam-binding protein with PASTA domain
MKGKPLARARARIAAAHCRVGRIKYARSRKKKGFVLAQSPPAGRSLPQGARINLTVSRGKRR